MTPPAAELARSPAAALVARYAAESGLFLFHYEHAAHRELPDDWVPQGRSDLAAPPGWEGGILAERKYQGFRHDQQIGGFHPGQRAKWSTHELCHGLVGFAWRPDATPLFHATAARLAELVPVVLWYFLDEIGLRRCPVHARDGALFRAFCPACERVATPVADDPDATLRLADARRFMDRELAAVARSKQLGRPVPHGWGSLDLCSDGVAYAHAHGPRLMSDTFRRYAERFLVPRGGYVESLEALEARAVAVFDALVGGAAPAPWAADPGAARARWQRQDVGWRLCTIAHDTSGEAADALWQLIDALALSGDIAQAAAAYRAATDEWVLPSVEEAFACGFALPDGLGSSEASLLAGLASACPVTCDTLDVTDSLTDFVSHDLANPSRAPIGERFADWLGPDGDLPRYEQAVAFIPIGDVDAEALGPSEDPRVRLATGARVLRFSCDVVALAEGSAAESGPRALVVGRVASDVVVLDVTPDAADRLEALGDGGPWNGDPREGAILAELGVLVPAAWGLSRSAR